MSLDGVYQPAVLNVKSDKDLAKDIREIVPEGKIYSYISVEMLRFYVVNFYNNDRVACLSEICRKKDIYWLVLMILMDLNPDMRTNILLMKYIEVKNGDVIFTILFICIILLRSKPVKGLLLFL